MAAPGVPLSNIVKVSAGAWQSYAIDSQGTVWAWGSNLDGELADAENIGNISRPVQVSAPGGVPVTSLSGGYGFSFLIDQTGAAFGIGYNSSGDLGIGASSDDWYEFQPV